MEIIDDVFKDVSVSGIWSQKYVLQYSRYAEDVLIIRVSTPTLDTEISEENLRILLKLRNDYIEAYAGNPIGIVQIDYVKDDSMVNVVEEKCIVEQIFRRFFPWDKEMRLMPIRLLWKNYWVAVVF